PFASPKGISSTRTLSSLRGAESVAVWTLIRRTLAVLGAVCTSRRSVDLSARFRRPCPRDQPIVDGELHVFLQREGRHRSAEVHPKRALRERDGGLEVRLITRQGDVAGWRTVDGNTVLGEGNPHVDYSTVVAVRSRRDFEDPTLRRVG